ncbi:unnamed protein product [Dovyalis caffra]|uniref:Uncharacterized protein n=1 Tax=Dovyalis caffra TaxID=77055 RepID=A0AAV1R5L6_9ROSI|nr:unnamed protein product [Dovyalis caffra]
MIRMRGDLRGVIELEFRNGSYKGREQVMSGGGEGEGKRGEELRKLEIMRKMGIRVSVGRSKARGGPESGGERWRRRGGSSGCGYFR